MDASKKVDLKIIIIGALGVGKTSLLHQYVHKTFYEDYRTTLGASILTKVLPVDSTPLKLQIWDTGGQERFRSMVSTFYKGSDGCMLAFDVTDRESFEALDNWRDDFLEKVIPREQDFPMVVLGNKIDLSDRQVRVEQGEQDQQCWGHHPCRDLKLGQLYSWGHGLVLDLMILRVFSNLNNSMIGML
uniref:Ras-related protein Rab-7b n=1 Tax=Zonotrichia albicollis TaxID=44394 RepID=A0A8D2MZ31_ZONAL